jgi:hypothetical protein
MEVGQFASDGILDVDSDCNMLETVKLLIELHAIPITHEGMLFCHLIQYNGMDSLLLTCYRRGRREHFRI